VHKNGKFKLNIQTVFSYFCQYYTIMKLNKSFIWSMVLLIVVSALYRIFPDRPLGFAPQWAMALFAGSVIKNRKWAFALPIFSMLISDVLYHFLFINGLTDITGFYPGQLTNYLLFAGVTIIGFLMKRVTVKNIFIFSWIGTTAFFLLSNFFVWMEGAGYQRPKTLEGLLMCYSDGLPFYRNSFIATLMFSSLFFGCWWLLTRRAEKLVTT
jgi:hypothetical protein